MSGADGDPCRRRRDLVRSSILAHLDSDEPGLVDLLAALCGGVRHTWSCGELRST